MSADAVYAIAIGATTAAWLAIVGTVRAVRQVAGVRAVSEPRVFVTRRVPQRVQDELERSFAIDVHDAELPPEREDLLSRTAGCDGLLTMLTDRVDVALLDAAGPQLRIVANYAVGLDNVDLDECERRGITVSNTPDVLTDATAEMTIALMLALTRRVVEGDRFLRRQETWQWAPTFMLGRGLSGLTLSIVGYGRIGQAVERLSVSHGMRVIHSLSLDELLGVADIVSLHVPLTDDTRHLIGDRELGLMKPTAYLVNTSRGPVVDEAALAGALAEGRIGGAALDVFEREPEVEAALLRLDNVVLVPHLASATHDAREAMGMLCVKALREVLLS
jgi:glyoxylate reductase